MATPIILFLHNLLKTREPKVCIATRKIMQVFFVLYKKTHNLKFTVFTQWRECFDICCDIFLDIFIDHFFSLGRLAPLMIDVQSEIVEISYISTFFI